MRKSQFSDDERYGAAEDDMERIEREHEAAERREMRKAKDQRRREAEDYLSQVSRPRQPR